MLVLPTLAATLPCLKGGCGCLGGGHSGLHYACPGADLWFLRIYGTPNRDPQIVGFLRRTDPSKVPRISKTLHVPGLLHSTEPARKQAAEELKGLQVDRA